MRIVFTIFSWLRSGPELACSGKVCEIRMSFLFITVDIKSKIALHYVLFSFRYLEIMRTGIPRFPRFRFPLFMI
jgi:hypothetical protein